ncbi:MAG: HYExAFE family protein [Phycisphaerales bacterium]
MESWRHYERAFHEYLRRSSLAYVSVDQVRAQLLPPLRSQPRANRRSEAEASHNDESAIKFFDFVIYDHSPSPSEKPTNLLVELKGRRIGTFSMRDGKEDRAPRPVARMECWTTRADIASLLEWEKLFGDSFQACVVFVYWCDDEPPAPLFQEVFEFEHRWYALRSIPVKTYVQHMKVRSPRWGTLDIPQDVFERVSHPFAAKVKEAGPFNDLVKARSLRELAEPAAALPEL